MAKVLDPILAKALLNDDLIESIAVKMPTNAIIPNEIINTVRIERKRLSRIDRTAILKFSVAMLPLLNR
jgi:hypothetical protein